MSKAEPGSTKVAFVGIGVMGRSMAGHLLAAGYDVAPIRMMLDLLAARQT